MDVFGVSRNNYLSTLLIHHRGSTSHEDIRIIDGVLYPSFKDTCYAMGLLNDHKEYNDGITEVIFWGSPNYLRNLLVMLLIASSVSRLEYVWKKTWSMFTDDILYRKYHLLGIDGTG